MLQMDAENFCIDGKLAPTLYLLGAQKSATTSLAYDLMEAGITSAAGSSKEWHWIEHPHPRGEWLKILPDCPLDGSKKLLADFTPINLKLTKLPDGMRLYRGWPDTPNHMSRRLERFDQVQVPQMLQDFYDNTYKASVRFVVMLRDPLARMQSAWYGLEHPPLNKGRQSFSDDVRTAVDFFQRSNGQQVLDWMWRSMYVTMISQYLSFFVPSQFIVIPMKLYVKHNKKVVNRILSKLSISQRAGAPEDWHAPENRSTRINQGEHPSLDKDIDEEVRASFDSIMTEYNEQLITVLTQMHFKGAHLLGMPEEHPTWGNIKTWLYDNW